MRQNSKKDTKTLYRLRNKGGILFMLSLFAILFILSLRFGSAKMSFKEFISAVFAQNKDSVGSIIFFSIRLPRAFAAAVAGMGLGVSGVLLQSVTGNDLAGPNIIGVNAGAGFMMILAMCFFPKAFYLQSAFAFCGALGASLIIIAISSKISHGKSTVILSGIALTSLLNAGISLISLIDEDVLTAYNYFSVGSVSGVKISEVIFPFTVILLCLSISLILAKKIDLLYLGDEIAVALGLNVNSFRFLCIILASASAAAVVSFAGLLGFVGLVVPHIARNVVGNSSRYLIIFSALIGSCIVLVADTLGRLLLSPTDIPVGIVMAFIGVPFFMYLLLRRIR